MKSTRPAQDIVPYKYTFHFVLIVILISICYANTLVQEWHFDDYPNIVDDQNIHWEDISLDTVIKTITNDAYGSARFTRPLPRISFGLNYYLSGLHTFSYHLTNILIHIITASFAYLVFIHFLEVLAVKGKSNWNKEILWQDIALLGAVLWAIHPLQTQAVTFIVQRMATMAAMFYIMSMFCYMKARAGNRKKSQIVFFYLVSFVLWICAIASKENAVLLPMSLVLYEVIFFGINRKKIVSVALMIGVLIIVSFIFLSITRERTATSPINIVSLLAERILTPYDARPFTLTERLLTESRILLYYLFLVICPVSDYFSMESDIQISTNVFNPPTTLLSILIIVTMVVFSTVFCKKYRLLSFAILFFFVNHLVESSVIGLELYFEHRNYLPSMFIYLYISYFMMWGIHYYAVHRRRLMKSLVIFFVTMILISEGNATFLRNDNWRSEESLCLDNIEKAPNNIRPRISLASYYIRKNRLDEAQDLLEESERIVDSGTVPIQKNWLGMLYHNYGAVYYQKSDSANAIDYLLKSVEFDQYSWKTHSLLGLLFYKDGNLDQSVKAYTNSVNIYDGDTKVFNMFGRALFESGDVEIALEALQKALDLSGKNNDPQLTATIQLNIVACYLFLGDIDNAQRSFDSIRENTNDIAYMMYRSIIYPELSDESFAHIADVLVRNREQFCDWAALVRENRFPGIIYPSIEEIESSLLQIYNEKLDDLIGFLGEEKENSKTCLLNEDG